MFDITRAPARISKKIAGLDWMCDNVGKSSSTVLLFDEMVLKIEEVSRSSEHEVKLLGWLDGNLPVPKIIEAETQDGYSLFCSLSGIKPPAMPGE